MKLVNKYIPFFKVGVHQSIAYKTNWLFIIVGNILNCFVSFYLWKAIFDSNKSKSFLGFSLEEMIVYIFVTFITKTMIGSDVTDEIGQEIKDGSIAIRLLKPISYNTTFIYKEIGEKVINLALLFVTIIVGVEIYRYRMSGLIQLSIERLLFFVISVVLSYFINVFLNITYGFTAFFFKNLWGSNMLKNCIISFMSGSIIPFDFLPYSVEKVLNVLPFASLNYVPVLIYMGRYSKREVFIKLGIQIFWIFLFWGLSKIMWKIAFKHLVVQGG